jgi:hypothetical protein
VVSGTGRADSAIDVEERVPIGAPGEVLEVQPELGHESSNVFVVRVDELATVLAGLPLRELVRRPAAAADASGMRLKDVGCEARLV